MAIHHFQTSFNAGELTPQLDARVGVEKYTNGCRRLKNFLVSVHGPATKRPGLENIGAAYTDTTPARLIGLNFSATTSFVVEITTTKFRFWTNGVLVAFTLDHPYSDTDYQDVQAAQVNDVIYLTHPNYNPRILERYGNADWRLREIHQPATGWTPPAAATPPTGNCVLERWITGPLLVTTLVLADAVCAQYPPNQVIPMSGAPIGTLGNWSASIQRVRGWFVPRTTGTYKFRAINIDDMARVRFNSTAYGGESGAVTIIEASINQTVDSPDYSLVAGSAYWIEFLHNDMAQPSVGRFNYFIGGVDQGYVTATSLAAQLNTPTGTTLDGWPALLDENTDARTITPSGTSGSITLTGSAAIWEAGHVGAWWQISHAREGAYAEIIPGTTISAGTSATTLRAIGRVTVYTYGTWTATIYLEELNPDGTTWRVMRTWRSVNDRNVVETITLEGESILRLRTTTGTSVAASGANPDARFMVEAGDARVYGLVRITGFTSSTSVTATVYKVLHAATATPLWTEGAWSAVQGYPRTVCLHQQRTQWGGTLKRPQSIWGSVTGDFENFRRSTFDDGSYLYQIASENSFLIQWMLSQGDLLIGTSLDEWIASAPENAPITPVNLSFRRQSAIGSEYKQAVLIRETVVFVQRNAIALSRMIYRENGRYGASEITILASHLFRGVIRQMAWQAQPSSVLWVVLQNGSLVGLTYEEDQNVFACHEHTTDGLFKSVSVIHGPQGDEVWVCVLRGTAYRIERFEPRTLFAGAVGDTTARRCYVDAAVLKESATAFTSVTGLAHLNGKTVKVFADGAERADATVSGGAITLSEEANVVCVGLGYTSELQPMKLEAQMQNGTAQGRRFKVCGVVLRLLDSLGGKVAANIGGREEVIEYRSVETPMDAAPPIFSGDKELSLSSTHGNSVDVIVTHSEPLPFTLAGLVVKVDIYEN
jgi:hypothetical protein